MTTLADILWRPAAPPLQILAVVVILLALAAYAYARALRTKPRSGVILLAMRAGLILGLGLLLMGPSRLPPHSSEGAKPSLNILLDTSASMTVADMDSASRFRYAVANWLNPSRLENLSREADLSLMAFDAELRPLAAGELVGNFDALAAGMNTRLTTSVSSALAQVPPSAAGSALLILSDGRDLEGLPVSSAAAAAKRAGIPIHTVCLGAKTSERDLALTAAPMQDYLMTGEPGKIQATVYQAGFDNADINIIARINGKPTAHPVRLDGPTAVVEIPITHDQAGQYEYTLSIDPQPGESVTTNNTQPVFIEVTSRRINVLLLEGQPFWDTKFIAQSLRKDERIKLTQLTRLNDTRTEAISTRDDGRTKPSIPSTADQFASYDLVILGRGLEHILTPASAAALRDWVGSRSGQVIFARGRGYDPATPEGRALARELAPLEPVGWGDGALQDLSAEISTAGRGHPSLAFASDRGSADSILRRLPALSALAIVERLKPAAVVLANATPKSGTGTGYPALVAMTYGRGGTLTMLAEGHYRWGLLPADAKDLEGFYDALWSSLTRWMVLGGEFRPDEQVSLRLSTSAAKAGDPVQIDVALRFGAFGDNPPELMITEPGAQPRRVGLRPTTGRDNRLRAEIQPRASGIYTVTLRAPGLSPESQSRKLCISGVDMERLLTSADPAAMKDLAAGSGGLSLRPDRPGELTDLLERHRIARIVPPRPKYIWDSGFVLVLLLGWAGAEWIGRRRGGLL